MPWIEFTSDFDFSPSALGGRTTIAYKTGMVENVTSECAEQALAAKKGKRAPSPRKQEKAENEEAQRG